MIISRRYYVNSIGYPSESASSSKWHAWFASCYLGRCQSTWPMTAVSCPTAPGTLCSQPFSLAWCHEHSAVMAKELLQPQDLVLACTSGYSNGSKACIAVVALIVQLRNPDITYGLSSHRSFQRIRHVAPMCTRPSWPTSLPQKVPPSVHPHQHSSSVCLTYTDRPQNITTLVATACCAGNVS